MAVTTTTRLGLTKWSAGTDPFTRAQANADADALEAVVGITLQGVFGSRPAAGVQRRLYWATDRQKLYIDDGSVWTELSSVRSGDVIMSAGSAVTAGYLECDGSAVSRTTYAELYAALGGASSPWGQGDGTTTFNLPNLTNRVPWGRGTPALGAAAAVGSHGHTQDAHNHVQDTHTHTQAAHNHTQDTHNHTQTAHNHTQDAHGHGHTIGVAGNNFDTAQTPSDHTHSFAAGVNTLGDGNHTHNYSSGGSGVQGTSGQNENHQHSLGGITTTGFSNNHAHNANHGHSVTGGVSNGTATNQATTAVNATVVATNQATTATNAATTATNQATTATNQATAPITGVGLRFLIKT